MFQCKTHINQGEKVVAICDSEHLGKKFSHDDIEFHVRESFYGGGEKTIDYVVAELEDATIANLFGNNIISQLIEKDILDEDSVIDIAGIKHAQLMSI